MNARIGRDVVIANSEVRCSFSQSSSSSEPNVLRKVYTPL
jgi:hypothetical protein